MDRASALSSCGSLQPASHTHAFPITDPGPGFGLKRNLDAGCCPCKLALGAHASHASHAAYHANQPAGAEMFQGCVHVRTNHRPKGQKDQWLYAMIALLLLRDARPDYTISFPKPVARTDCNGYARLVRIDFADLAPCLYYFFSKSPSRDGMSQCSSSLST